MSRKDEPKGQAKEAPVDESRSDCDLMQVHLAARVAGEDARVQAARSLEVGLVDEGLGVELGHVLRARGASREPALLGDHLESADRGGVAGSLGQLGRVTGQTVLSKNGVYLTCQVFFQRYSRLAITIAISNSKPKPVN